MKSSDLTLKIFKTHNNKVVEISSRVNKIVINLSKNSMYMPNIRVIKKSTFLIPNTKKTFNYFKALILRHFSLENHIQIKINTSNYAKNKVLSLLKLDFDIL